jgi:hypothetical protein
VGVRELGLGALAVVMSACLGVPPDANDEPPAGDIDGARAPPDGAPGSDGGAIADAAACGDAFAVAYTSQLDVRPTGGSFAGVLVIAALGKAVDLSDMVDDADDSVRLELELTQPNYDPLAVGAVKGELDPTAAALIIGPLVDPADWTETGSPTFALTFAERAEQTPPPHRATARLRIGGSTAALEFDLTYVAGQDEVAVPRAGAMVYSACAE